MRYASIDIETTGLDSTRDQILEIAVVLDDLRDQKPLMELRSYHAFVSHDRISGNVIALSMNARILACLANKVGNIVPAQDAAGSLMKFFLENGHTSVLAAGKNFGSFDLQFLRALPNAHNLKFKHRSIDPTHWFLRGDDDVPPKLEVCCQRAGLEGLIFHTAMDDALAIVQLTRLGWGKNFPGA